MDNLQITIKRMSDGATFGIGLNKEWALLKKGLDGFGNFTNSIQYEDNALHDGGLITSKRMTKTDRTIKCCHLYYKNNNVARQKALKFFNTKDTFKIIVTYADRKVFAVGSIYKFILPASVDIYNRLDLTVTFMFESPYWKSYDDYGKDIASITGKIAFPYISKTSGSYKGLTGGIFNYDKLVHIYNNGDVPTYCRAVIKATGSVLNPSLIIGDQYVKVYDTMQSGDEIEMDFTNLPPTVKKNGENWIGHCDRLSNFADMIINLGEVVIAYNADDGDKYLQVYFYYNELYSAI